MKNITQHTPLQSYDVEIKATVRKTITVEAGDEKSAAEQAHELFTTDWTGEEYYEQDTVSVTEAREEYEWHLWEW